MSLVSSAQVFTNLECERLRNSIKNTGDEEIIVQLSKTEDDVWFDVVYEFIKKHNPLKLAISSISEMSIIKPENGSDNLNDLFTWSTSHLETKLNFLINISEADSFVVVANAGAESQMRSLDKGACCVWPSFATSTIQIQTQDTSYAIYGTVIGKKLN